MKIREYWEITRQYEEEFERRVSRCRDGLEDPAQFDALGLFDAIELRDADVQAWLFFGRTWDDEVPEPSNKLIMPSFET